MGLVTIMADTTDKTDLRALLRWYAEMGVDDVVGAEPSDMTLWGNARPIIATPKPQPDKQETAPPPKTAPSLANTAPMPADEAVAEAKQRATTAQDIATLRLSIESFEGCGLKASARNTVIDDGIEGAALMVLGEAPGRDEDLIGKPFVGRAGQLLDRMLGAIGHSRHPDDGKDNVHITNMIYWRPPGNRNPTRAELLICLPFVERMIELSKPQLILLAGNTPTQGLHDDAPGITRARGSLRSYKTASGFEVQTLSIFHPAYLLRQPEQKRLAWADLLMAQKILKK